MRWTTTRSSSLGEASILQTSAPAAAAAAGGRSIDRLQSRTSGRSRGRSRGDNGRSAVLCEGELKLWKDVITDLGWVLSELELDAREARLP